MAPFKPVNRQTYIKLQEQTWIKQTQPSYVKEKKCHF